MPVKRKHLLLHISLFLSLILLSVLSMRGIQNLYEPPRGGNKIIFNENIVLINPLTGTSTNHIPFNILFSEYAESQMQPLWLETRFIIDTVDIQNPALVIPVMDGNALQVFFNGKEIGHSGDIRSGQSTRWNHSEYFHFPREYLKAGENVLRIKVIALSSIGMTSPFYISEDWVAKRHTFILNTLNNSLVLISIGFLFLLGVIFLSIGFYIDRNWGRVFLGIALLLLALYFFDYFYMEILAYPYAIFKKVVMACFYSSLGFLSMAYCREYRAKHKWPSDLIAALLFVSALVLLLLPADTIVIKNIYYKINLLVIVFLINTLILVFKNFLTRRDVFSAAQFYVMGFIFPLFVHDLLGLFLTTNIILFVPQAIIIFYLLTAAVIIFSFVDVHKQMISHRKKSVLELDKNYIDSLTGVFQQKIIRQIRDLIPQHFAVCLLDIDDLNHFNKKYGYYTGDYILSTFAYLLKNTTRATDYIIRYQEDSFVVLLAECNLSTATQIVTELRKTVDNHQFVLEGYKITDTISFSAGVIGKGRYENTQDLLNKAEELLHESKQAGPGNVRYDEGM